jgi:hypothetical protein
MSKMQAKKTHEQQLRTLERKDDHPDARRPGNTGEKAHMAAAQRRQSEFAVSRGGTHQESDHNKHNEQSQGGHKPQQHSVSEEKKA